METWINAKMSYLSSDYRYIQLDLDLVWISEDELEVMFWEIQWTNF